MTRQNRKTVSRREEIMGGLAALFLGLLGLVGFFINPKLHSFPGFILMFSGSYMCFSIGFGLLSRVVFDGEKEGIYLFIFLLYRKGGKSKIFHLPFGFEVAFHLPSFLMFVNGSRAYKYLFIEKSE